MVKDEWPEAGELVVCTAKELKTFGVFATLDEYDGKEGFIHISAVATGWVKHLRDYVRENQKIVCKVLNVDAQRGHIDLSLKAVKEGQRRERIKAWKNEKKAKKWLALVGASANIELSKEELGTIELELVDAYGGLYDAFHEILRGGKSVLTALGIKEEVADAINEVALANVKLPSVQITGYMELTCPLPNGVDILKAALKKAKETIKSEPSDTNGLKLECFYIGAPKYKMRITAPDYKKAESILSDAASAAIEEVKKNEGYGKFYRTLS